MLQRQPKRSTALTVKMGACRGTANQDEVGSRGARAVREGEGRTRPGAENEGKTQMKQSATGSFVMPHTSAMLAPPVARRGLRAARALCQPRRTCTCRSRRRARDCEGKGLDVRSKEADERAQDGQTGESRGCRRADLQPDGDEERDVVRRVAAAVEGRSAGRGSATEKLPLRERASERTYSWCISLRGEKKRAPAPSARDVLSARV